MPPAMQFACLSRPNSGTGWAADESTTRQHSVEIFYITFLHQYQTGNWRYYFTNIQLLFATKSL